MAWVRLCFLVGVLAVAACAPQGGSYQGRSYQGGVSRESIDYADRGWKAYQRGDYRVAFQAWFKDAQRGLAYAQFNIGYLFEEGLGVKQDDKVAVYWYRKAAEQGHADAQQNLELLYAQDEEIEQYNRAAQIGNEGAEARERGDYKTAYRNWRSLADQGDAIAQNNLGVLYAEGQWVKQDYEVAAHWYRLSARQGFAIAQNNLGNLYYSGWGVEKNYEEAARWFQMAADQGNEDAISNLELIELIYGERIESSPPLDGSLYDLEATGTGFSVSSNGYILTNDHVIDGCAMVRVTSPLSVVRVVARDEENDLALLWHDSGESLSPVGWRDGSEVRLGEEVVIAGYPFQGILTPDLGVTTGSISALSGLGGYWPHFQISAPVQPGNSGSPLLDRTGQVIGVVVAELDEATMIENTGNLPQNVNFAIRSEVAFKFLAANGVPYIKGNPATTVWERIKSFSGLSTEDIADQARSHTVRIECWR